MSVLFHFKETNIDRKATIVNVRQFFTDDIPQLEEMAGQSLNAMLSSPRLDNVGSPGTHLSSTEDLMVSSVDAKRELRIIAKTLNQCSKRSRDVIVLRYMKHLTVSQICAQSYLGHTAVYTHTYDAFLEFANRYYYASGHDLRIYVEQ